MGGQEQYRTLYLEDRVYFDDTDFFYCFIDKQDTLNNIEKSRNYLNDLLNIYHDLKYSNEIIICLNKFDPSLKDSKEYIERISKIKSQITHHNNFKFKFFTTSFYNIAPISKAVSYALINY